MTAVAEIAPTQNDNQIQEKFSQEERERLINFLEEDLNGGSATLDAQRAPAHTVYTTEDAPVMRDYDEDGYPVQTSGGLSYGEVNALKEKQRAKEHTNQRDEHNRKKTPDSERLGLTKDERAGQRDVALRDIRARLSRALEGHRGDLTDPQTRQRITIDMNSIRPREGTHNQDGMPIFEVPVVLRDAQGRVAKEKYLTVDEAEDFINYALYTQQKHKEMVEPDDRNGAELSGADYSKIAKTVLEDARSVDKDYANNNSLKRVPEENKQQSVDGARQEQQQETVASEENMEEPEEVWKNAQEKLARKKEAVRTAERAVVDMAQEIGQLREEIAQTEGSLAEHEETISALMAKLDVARDSFGNYGEETEMLRRKLDSLKENLQRLQVRVQAEKAPDAEAAAPSDVEMESFENAKQKARESGAQSFVFNGETYTRVGSRYILNPQVDSGEEVVAAENDYEEPATENKIEDYKKKFMAQVEGAQEQEGKQKEVQEEAQENEQEGRILPEQLHAELAVAREAFAQAKLNGAQESAALQERYKSVREAYLQMYREDPQLYAQMAAREMEQLIAAMRTAAGSDVRKQKIVGRFRHDALTDPTMRRAFGVGKQTAELRDVQAFVDEATVNGRPNTEQFILEDGENLSEAERVAKALAVLEGAVDEKFERLAATDLEKKYGGLLGRRLVQRVFEGIKRMKQTRADVRAAREAHEQWEKSTYDERKEKAGTSEPSYLMGGRNKAHEEVLAAREAHEQWEKERLEQRHKNDHSTDDVNIPELTEVVNHSEIEREAVKKIAQILKEEHLAIDLFENVNVSDFATDSAFDRNARQFALTYVNDAIEEFGDEVNPQKNTTLKDMTLKDYLKFVEEKRLPIKGKV